MRRAALVVRDSPLQVVDVLVLHTKAVEAHSYARSYRGGPGAVSHALVEVTLPRVVGNDVELAPLVEDVGNTASGKNVERPHRMLIGAGERNPSCVTVGVSPIRRFALTGTA